MITHRRQSGMSILGILCILLMLGFFIMCAIRISPPFFEYLSVRQIIANIATDPESKEASTRQIQRKIDANFNTNQIYELEAKEVEIFRRRGKTYIDANYEVRLPILWRIDAVIKFDDLLYEVGKDKPIDPLSVPKK